MREEKQQAAASLGKDPISGVRARMAIFLSLVQFLRKQMITWSLVFQTKSRISNKEYCDQLVRSALGTRGRRGTRVVILGFNRRIRVESKKEGGLLYNVTTHNFLETRWYVPINPAQNWTEGVCASFALLLPWLELIIASQCLKVKTWKLSPQSKDLELGAPCFQLAIYKDPWASHKKFNMYSQQMMLKKYIYW